MDAVVSEAGRDVGVAWHYGDPMREQRLLETGVGAVDLSNRGVLTVSGPDRLTWLHSLTTQYLEGLAPGVGVTALVLSPQGHLEHALYGVDDGETFWAHTEPQAASAVVAWLDRMRFMMRVDVADRSDEYGVLWQVGEPAHDSHLVVRAGLDSLGGFETLVPLDELAAVTADLTMAGTWAYEARRIATGVPRIGVDTDSRTIPNEIGLLGIGVHLDKGCYRGQETVARVHTLGAPPRRLVRLHLDGTAEALPAPGSPVTADGRAVGFVGSSARHFELGPIALGMVKRNLDQSVQLVVDEIAASQETLVDPDVGLHVRARL